jgi:hemerythrin-like domain-containing protein
MTRTTPEAHLMTWDMTRRRREIDPAPAARAQADRVAPDRTAQATREAIVSLKSKFEKAKGMAAAKPSDDGAENDILDTLKKEHQEVKDLLSQLENAANAATRRSLVKRIKEALVPHTEAEQKVLYKALVGLSDDEDAQVDGYEGYVEHKRAADTLKELEAVTEAASPKHQATAKVLKELVTHHIKEEEANVWSDARKHFSKEERTKMNTRYLAEKERIRV